MSMKIMARMLVCVGVYIAVSGTNCTSVALEGFEVVQLHSEHMLSFHTHPATHVNGMMDTDTLFVSWLTASGCGRLLSMVRLAAFCMDSGFVTIWNATCVVA